MVVRALIVSILLIVSSCKDKITDNDKSNTDVTISVYEKSCTEVWLDVEYDNVGYKREISISIQEQEILKTNISNDTILYLNGFEANQNYDLAIELPETETHSGYKTTLNVSTLPLTNQNFTWEKYYFGEHSTSAFYDVEIIDEDNIWVVGEIYLNDSLGYIIQEPVNEVRLENGNIELLRLPISYNGSNYYGAVRDIQYFNGQSVIYGIGSTVEFDGKNYVVNKIPETVFPSRINEIWGRSRYDYYVVGNNGSIAYYNGTQWYKVSTGTSLPINDIHGAYNKKAGEWEILATSGSVQSSREGNLFRIAGIRAESLDLSGMEIEGYLGGLWFIPNLKYIFGSGWGTYVKGKLSEEIWNKWQDVDRGTFNGCIEANGLNDVFLAGGLGQVLHFNGEEVKSFIYEINFTAGNILSLKVKGDLVVGVGTDAHQAVIVIGKR